MPIIIVCPQCSTKLSAPDYAAGKIAKCPKVGCGFLIPVPATVESAAASPLAGLNNDTPSKPAAQKTVKAAAQEEPPLVKETKKSGIGEDDEELPRGKRRRDYEENAEDEFPRKKRRPSEDDEDDLPRSKRRRVYDDEENDRRRKKKKKKQSAGLPPVAIAGIVVSVLLLLGGGGYGIYALVSSDKSKDTSSSSGSGFGSGTRSVPPGWVEVKSQAGFKAYFPVKPRVSDTRDGSVWEGEDKSMKSSCTVVVSEIPGGIPPDQLKDYVDKVGRASAGMVGGKEISHTDARLAGQRVTEYLIEYLVYPPLVPPGFQPGKSKLPSKPQETKPTEGRAVSRVLASDITVASDGIPVTRIYYVFVKCDTGMPREDWISGFFDNFELIK